MEENHDKCTQISERNVFVTDTARSKSDRYLTEKELKTIVLEGDYEIYQETSPVNPEMYEDDVYILRGRFNGNNLDLVVEINGKSIVVITQKGQHGVTYKESDFYEHFGQNIISRVHHHLS